MSETTTASEDATPEALKERLRGRTLRTRTGLLLVPPSRLPDVPEIAARLGVDSVDYARVILESLPPGAKRAGITADAEQARLDSIAEAPDGTDVVLVGQFDLAVSRLTMADRGRLWRVLREGFAHRRRALLVVMPLGAAHLLPEGAEWDAWQDGQRVARWMEE